jgi:valyl-tRNA synthetase
VPEELAKAYDPRAVEEKWYRVWESRGHFQPRPGASGKTFTIAMPPPNITGELHMGHAMYTVQDVLCRWHRMLGDTVLWIPGTDHAAISTNRVINDQLAREGSSGKAIGRDAFTVRVEQWYRDTGNVILDQIRRLGFSCDWGRLRFTMDARYSAAVRHVFVELWRRGYIYRGPRIVNWCPNCLSTHSDLEIDYREVDDQLYFLRYPLEGGGAIEVATVRPETMVGDTAVAIHPDDARYRAYHGRTAILPLLGRRLPIVTDDEGVDPQQGTGAVKVTPGHDPADYDIGQRHQLKVLNILHPDGRMNIPALPELDGLPLLAARKRIVEMLRAAGALVMTQPYRHSVGHCDQCKTVIEPLVSEQWWVRMEKLAPPAIEVVESRQIRFHPERWAGDYLRWMRNLRDWNISRQIWLGHRIPVWTCGKGHQAAYQQDPVACDVCGDTALEQDPDVLDTWFSAALWPFATLGWPEETEDLRRFYPTQVLDTGRDILYLWVARMIFMSLEFTGKIPFADVIIHANVQNETGQRMSKSLGTGLDPLKMIAAYGADATRAWPVMASMAGQDVRFSELKLQNYRDFTNKLWNAARFVLMKLDGEGEAVAADGGGLELADRWILSRCDSAVGEVTRALERFAFGTAMDKLYDFLWHEFADYYLELIKPRLSLASDTASRRAALTTAASVLERYLRILHPIMPFITEELWQRLPHQGETIMYAPWPAARATDPKVEMEMGHLIAVVQEIRRTRHDAGVADRIAIPANVRSSQAIMNSSVGMAYLRTLARLAGEPAKDGAEPVRVAAGDTEVLLQFPRVDGAHRERQERKLGNLHGRIRALEEKLSNPGFTSKAPSELVEQTRALLAQLRLERDRLSGSG